ncbi:unnamed protein product [Camellia sinensis]
MQRLYSPPPPPNGTFLSQNCNGDKCSSYIFLSSSLLIVIKLTSAFCLSLSEKFWSQFLSLSRMDSGSAPATAKVQHLTKASSDELLRKFAEVGSGSKDKATAKKELSQLAKRRRHHRKKSTRENDFGDDEQYCENPSSSSSLSRRASLVERKSLLPAVAASTQMSSALIRRLGIGIGRSRLRSRDFKNLSIFATIDKTWRKTVDRASKVFLEMHYNQHKRLINDIA